MTKAKETTVQSPSVGADGGPPSKMYTPISAETENRFRSDLSLKSCRATMRDGCDDCDGVFGGGNFIVAPSRRKKAVADGLLEHEKIKFEAVV